MTNPVYLALDLPRLDDAVALARRVKGHIGGIKLGLEFFCAHGGAGVHAITHVGLPIFLDLKFHDIPNTVAGAMQAIHVLEPAIVTVHAAGGRAMMEDAKAAAAAGTKVVAVTMLTSLDDRDLARTGVDGSAHDQVMRLADLARDAGLDGIVCSGQRSRRGASAVEGWFLRRSRPAPRWRGSRRSETRRDPARRPRCRGQRAGDRASHRKADDPLAAARAIEATL